MNITEAIGKDVMYGAPGHEYKETIKQVTFLEDSVEVVFKSKLLTTMTLVEFEHFIRYEELSYYSNGLPSKIVFCD